MFPPAVTVRLPFTGFVQITSGTSPGSLVGGWFVANSLSKATIVSPTNPRGQNGLIQWLNTAGTLPFAQNGAYSDTAVLSQMATNPLYNHMGNIYQKYRVIGWSFKIQAMAQTNVTAVAIVETISATDDFDLASQANLDTVTSMVWTSAKNLPYTKQRTSYWNGAPGSTGTARVPNLYKAQSAYPLVKDKVYFTDEKWIGLCTPGVAGAAPTYSAPTNSVYCYFGIQNIVNSALHTISSGTCSIILEYTPIVKFFEPHQNLDYLNPL